MKKAMIALEMAVIILAMTACHTIRQEVGSLGNYVQDDVTMQQELSGPTRQNDCLSGSASFYTESEAVNFSLSVTAKNTVSVTLSETEDADGCEIEYTARNKEASPVPTLRLETNEKTTVFSDLIPNEIYSFRVRVYQIIQNEKVYSKWSHVKRITNTMNQKQIIDGATYFGDVLITNKTYALPEDYGTGLKMEVVNAFREMASDAAKDGITLWIVSGYRSYETQVVTYQYNVNQSGREKADRVSARPGHSEHQTGLSLDINSTLDSFAGTPEAIWLEKHCVQYGFIIRYPKEKESVTGYQYEPWHIRYLGKEKAAEIACTGLTLEEYFGITSRYNED